MRIQRWVASACLLCGALSLGAHVAHGQSSTNFNLSPGVLGAGGSGSSANFRLTGELTSGRSRGSSPNFDVIGGFVGGAFSAQAVVSLGLPAAQYASIALPVRPASKVPTAVFAALGSPGASSWLIGHWSSQDSAYAFLGGTPTVSTVELGEGYWLGNISATTVAVTGRPAPNALAVLPLASGPGGRPAYNQLGNPFLYPINVSDLIVQNGVTVALNNPANTLTEQVVKVWNGSAYVNASVINGRQAFWVKKLASGAVNVLVNPIASSSGSPGTYAAKPPQADWAVAVQVRQGRLAAEQLMVGAANVRKGEWNPLNLSLAPPPPGHHLTASMLKVDWGRMNGEYVRDFIPEDAVMEWEFVVRGAEAPGEIALEFTGFDLPAGRQLFLTDLSSGSTREVLSGQTLHFAAVDGPRRFRLAATMEGFEPAQAPLAEALHFAYPNPFRAGVGLTFTLPARGDIRVEIFDLMGRRVQTLERLGASPGEHVVVWDGRDRSGNRVENGVYLARYLVGSTQGTTRLVSMQ